MPRGRWPRHCALSTTPANSTFPGRPPAASEEVEVLRSPAEIEAHSFDRQVGQDGHRRSHVSEVGGDRDVRAVSGLGQPSVGPIQRLQLSDVALLHQGRFVQANPLPRPAPQFGQHLEIRVDQRLEEAHDVEAPLGRCTPQQKGEGTDHRRGGGNAQARRFSQLVNRLGHVRSESGVGAEFGTTWW